MLKMHKSIDFSVLIMHSYMIIYFYIYYSIQSFLLVDYFLN